MAKRSSIDRLPDEVRARITSLRDQGRTIDEIMAALDRLDVDVSRSALGRHLKKADQIADQMRKSRAIAESIGRSFGDDETSKVARTNVELLHSLLMKFMTGPDDFEGEVVLDAKDAMFAATALEKLAKASKSDFDMQIKAAVERERQAVTEKAAEKAEATARKQGLSGDTVDAIKKSILGMA